MRSWNIQEDEVVVSFDGKFLFTDMPVDVVMTAVRKRLVNDIDLKERTGLTLGTVMDMLSFCLQTC